MNNGRRLVASVRVNDHKVFEAFGYDQSNLQALLISKCEAEGSGAEGDIKCLATGETLFRCKKSPTG